MNLETLLIGLLLFAVGGVGVMLILIVVEAIVEFINGK
jgi:hypothetical protein